MQGYHTICRGLSSLAMLLITYSGDIEVKSEVARRSWMMGIIVDIHDLVGSFLTKKRHY
jgi:hypothetical protein